MTKVQLHNPNGLTAADSYSSGTTLDEELSANYDASIVDYAKRLKEKHGNKYTDSFYLSYAKTELAIKHNKHYVAVLTQLGVSCEIQDPAWAGFSYEEIIEMENCGYVIPEDVLSWAHAQQESDITAYEVVSDEANLNDNTSTESSTSDSDINSLEKRAKTYTTMAQNAQEQAENDIEEYNVKKEKATKIKQEKENSYQNSMKEITDLTKEWKALDNKGKNENLSKNEQKRYEYLSKILGNDSSIIKDMNVDADELDNLLASMDLLESNAQENLTLATDTVKSAIDLAGLGSNLNSRQKTTNTKGVVYSGNGLLTDLLFGAKGTTVQRIALDAGKDLEVVANDTIDELNSSETEELSEFAQNYTDEAQATENNRKRTMKLDENGKQKGDNSKKTETAEKSEESNKKSSEISMEITVENAQKTTKKLIESMTESNKDKDESDKLHKLLKKQTSQAKKQSAKITKAATKIEQSETQNAQKSEELLAGLDDSQNNQVIPTDSQDIIEEQEGVVNGEQTGTNPEANKTKQQDVFAQLASLNTQSTSDKRDFQKLVRASKISTEGITKTTETLHELNTELIKKNNKDKTNAENAILLGTGLYTKGIVTAAAGLGLYLEGQALSAVPHTAAAGLALMKIGYGLIVISDIEKLSAVETSLTGATALILSDDIAGSTKESTSATKQSKNFVKSNSKEVQTSEKAIGASDSNSTSNSTDNTVSESSENGENTVKPKFNVEIRETATSKIKKVKKTDSSESNSDEKSEDLSIKFSYENSQKATDTMVKSIADLTEGSEKANKLEARLIKEMKAAKTSTKKITQEAQKTEEVFSQNKEKENSKITKLENMQNADATATDGATQKEAVVSELTALETENLTAKSNLTKVISSGMTNASKVQTTVKAVNENISDLVKYNLNGAANAAKATLIGTGTVARSFITSSAGVGLIGHGTALLANPLTISKGLGMINIGSKLLVRAGLEQTTGLSAIATASVGLAVTNSVGSIVTANKSKSKESSQEATANVKEIQDAVQNIDIPEINTEISNNSQKEPSKTDIKNEAADNVSNKLDQIDIASDDEDSEEVSDEEIAQNDNTDDTVTVATIASASATVNADVKNNVETDDKADRKLTRFNADSIIESKKKKKKVQAISATSGGKA